MTISVHGLAVSRGIAIGRAVIVASSRMDVAHYFVTTEQVPAEIERLRSARNAVAEEIERVQHSLGELGSNDAHPELSALLDVHLMLLQDEQLTNGVKHWIVDRHYNAEWALTTQLEVIARQFDEMEDPYLRERKADLEQLTERMLRQMMGGQLDVPDAIWSRVGWAWALFFVAMGFLNLYVAFVLYANDTDAWVTFKTWGTLALTLVFIVAQGLYLSRHALEPASDAASGSRS